MATAFCVNDHRPTVPNRSAYLIQRDPVLDSIPEPAEQEVRVADEIVYNV